MKLPIRTTLLIGNNKRGFTFIEVMVAMVILAAGIVGVYRSFFLCVDYLNNIASRWWANELIDAKINEVSYRFKESSSPKLEAVPLTQTVTVNHRPIVYHYDVELTPQLGLDGLFRLHVTLTWNDGHRDMTINRQVMILK